MTAPKPPSNLNPKLARQLRKVTILGILLIVVGVIVITMLQRLPTPVRFMTGLGDIFLGAVLLVLANQRRKGLLRE